MAPLVEANEDRLASAPSSIPSNMARQNPYQPLNKNQIRLVRVEPLTQSFGVSCTLIQVSRDDPGVYKALSYAWGDQLDLGVITVNGKPHVVRRTLEVALRTIRDSRSSGNPEPPLLWVDALCINQADAHERGEQVGKMRLVYERAQEVIVWLGPADDESVLAFDLMKEVRDGSMEISSIIHHSSRAKFDALKKLFRRQYWWRIWVIQEVASARQAAIPITMYCGTDHITWSNLLEVCRRLNEGKARENLKNVIYHDSPSDVFSVTRGGPNALEPSRSPPAAQGSSSPALLDLLSSHMSKHSTDPRDKIYGLVGYSSSREVFGKIDYTLPVRSLYIRTTQFIVSTTSSLDVICLQQNDDNPFELPSWVADWQRRLLHPRHRVIGLHIRSPPFQASGSSHAKVSFAPSGDEITAAGFVIDTINVVGQPHYLDGHEREVMPTLIAFHNWWNIFVKAKGDTQQNRDIFERTFCGGAWRPSYEEWDDENQKLQRLELFFGLLQRPLLEILEYGTGSITSPVSDGESLRRQKTMVSQASLRMHSKRLVISRSGFVGLAPMTTESGHTIAVLLGCSFPVILRDMQEYWVLVGEVYVDGIMNGESMSHLESGLYHQKNFQIR